jgi:hypothetical protein
MSNAMKLAGVLVTEARGKLSPLEYLKAAIREVDDDTVRDLAVAYLLSRVKNAERSGVLTVERSASRRPSPNQPGYQEWAARPENAAEVQANEQRQREYAAAEEKRSNEFADAREKRNREFWDEWNANFQKYKAELHVEWTNELLNSEFAVGDGTIVRWGDATREQHLARIAMHKRNAMAGLEGVARHQQAIAELDATGAVTLRDAVRTAA